MNTRQPTGKLKLKPKLFFRKLCVKLEFSIFLKKKKLYFRYSTKNHRASSNYFPVYRILCRKSQNMCQNKMKKHTLTFPFAILGFNICSQYIQMRYRKVRSTKAKGAVRRGGGCNVFQNT